MKPRACCIPTTHWSKGRLGSSWPSLAAESASATSEIQDSSHQSDLVTAREGEGGREREVRRGREGEGGKEREGGRGR